MPKSKYLNATLAASLFLFFAVIYGLSRNQTYSYDGLLFAGIAETDLSQLESDVVFEWNHFLWYPTVRVFYLALHALHLTLRGYEALQLFNALIGAAGVAVTFLILSGLVSRTWALAWSLISGFCAVYWIRSASAENYLLGTFWAICFAGVLVSYWRDPSYRHVAFMVMCAVLSAYYHLGNLAVFGATFAAILLRQKPKPFICQSAAAVLLFAFLWLPYAFVHRWFLPGGFSRWWIWSKGLADGYSPLQHPTGAFHWNIFKNLAVTGQTLVKSVLWFDSWNRWTILRFGSLIVLSALAMCYQRWKRSDDAPAKKKENSLAFIFLIPLLSVTALYAVWSPDMPSYWCVHTALFCLFAGALSDYLSPGRIFPLQRISLVLIIGLLAAQNLHAAVLPDKANPRQFVIDASSKIGEITPRASPVIISGRGGEWNYLKVYIPYFAHRNRVAIDLFVTSAFVQNADPVFWIQQEISASLNHGIPVYVTEDALKERSAFSDFHLSSGQIESIWKPYRLLPIQDFPGDPPNRLYLLWYDNFSKEVQDVMSTRLIVSGLLDQVLIVDREKARTDPSEKLANEIKALEAVVSKRSAMVKRNGLNGE